MQSQRKKFVILIMAVVLVVFGWITIGTGAEEVPYLSIAELRVFEGAKDYDRFRLGGLVAPGSIVYSGDRLSVDFVMSQGAQRLPVHFTGLTPDLFKDEAEVIIEGRYEGGVLEADNLMTKCASRYEVELTASEGAAKPTY
ncbi:MAG: cytochrome c maturation protein CcmE [Candidatus Neomarinimicrobiota bacterium]